MTLTLLETCWFYLELDLGLDGGLDLELDVGLVNPYLELDSGFVGPDLDWDLLVVTWGLLLGSILGS